jgi:hypothetical protein
MTAGLYWTIAAILLLTATTFNLTLTQSKRRSMKIKYNQLADLMDYIDTQSDHINDAAMTKLEGRLGKKEVKRMRRLYKKMSDKLDDAQYTIN